MERFVFLLWIVRCVAEASETLGCSLEEWSPSSRAIRFLHEKMKEVVDQIGEAHSDKVHGVTDGLLVPGDWNGSSGFDCCVADRLPNSNALDQRALTAVCLKQQPLWVPVTASTKDVG